MICTLGFTKRGVSVCSPGVKSPVSTPRRLGSPILAMMVSGYADNKLVIGSGTSQATAITTGVVASLLSRGNYGPNIIPLLTRTAEPLQAPATAVGAGLLQMPK